MKRKTTSICLILCFLISSLGCVSDISAGDVLLPNPGTMVSLSASFAAPVLKGIKVHPDNPFKFDFILDTGEGKGDSDQLSETSKELIKYFLASITIPDKDLWVNLSPYEKERIVPESFGRTTMGRDLLAQDYLLKQVTASLIYPEKEVGKQFWARVYEEARKRFGTANVPINTFNKVWIVPDKAIVYENSKAGIAYVVESSLKVMIEQDYLAIEHNHSRPVDISPTEMCPQAGCQANQRLNAKASHGNNQTNTITSQIVRDIVIPQLTTEVNQGANFAKMRQVYNAYILAAWYKKKVKDSLLKHIYADKNKVFGVNIENHNEKQRIYQRYLEAFKKGVYNYIKDDAGLPSSQRIPRKFFAGGVTLINPAMITYVSGNNVLPSLPFKSGQVFIVSSEITALSDMGMLNNSDVLLRLLEAFNSSLPVFRQKGIQLAFPEVKLPDAIKINGYDMSGHKNIFHLKMRITNDKWVMLYNLFLKNDKIPSGLIYGVDQDGVIINQSTVNIQSTRSNTQQRDAKQVKEAFDGFERFLRAVLTPEEFNILSNDEMNLAEQGYVLMMEQILGRGVYKHMTALIKKGELVPVLNDNEMANIHPSETYLYKRRLLIIALATASVGVTNHGISTIVKKLRSEGTFNLMNLLKDLWDEDVNRPLEPSQNEKPKDGFDEISASSMSAVKKFSKDLELNGTLLSVALTRGGYPNLMKYFRIGFKVRQQDLDDQVLAALSYLLFEDDVNAERTRSIKKAAWDILRHKDTFDALFLNMYLPNNPDAQGYVGRTELIQMVKLFMVSKPVQGQAKKASPAMLVQAKSATTGGIDLKPDNLHLQLEHSGEMITLNVDGAMLTRLKNAAGFSPVILELKPLADLAAFRSFFGVN